MKTKNTLSVLLLSALLYGLLFHNKSLGLNLVIYEAFVLGWLFYSKQLSLKSPSEKLIVSAQIITLIFTVLHHSIWSYFIHFSISFVLVGVMIAPMVRSLVNSIGLAFSNVLFSIHAIFTKEKEAEPESNRVKKGKYQLKKLRLYIIPLAIIILFATLYGFANPEFGKYVDIALGWLYDGIEDIFKSIDFWFFVTFAFGFLVSIYIFRRGRNEKIIELDTSSNDDKVRQRNPQSNLKTLALKNEFRVGIFLFASLNILLLAMNIMDIDHVWINFEWKGQYLRQFVHYGTIVLLVAIALSVLLVLYFFRGNLNFYKKNKLLKKLCYIWLGQNIILAISTGVRNYYYIQHYSLAYRRIAIVFFLILAIYGLYSVYVKVRDTRSNFYIVRKNAVVWTVVLSISAGFNWDRIIAEYNFSRGKGSFVHLNFLAHLSDSALPELDQPTSKLNDIDQYQESSFFKAPGSSVGYRKLYISPKSYAFTIEWRKQVFKDKWEKKSWLEWNYAEARAYRELKDKIAF